MSIELILLLVIVGVLIFDFVKNSRKKSTEKELEVLSREKNNSGKIIIIPFVISIILILFSATNIVLEVNYNDLFLKYFIPIQNLLLDFNVYVSVGDFFEAMNIVLIIGICLLLLSFRKLYDYAKKRKKNISLFIILIVPMKVLFHFLFFNIGRYETKRGAVFNRKERVGNASFSEHTEGIFEYDLFIFPLVIFLMLFFVWYFNDKIKAR